MNTKQILFRLESDIAKALENKLTEKGISKQFLFSKVVEQFINDQLSFDNNLLTSIDNKEITIDSIKVAETIKKHYLTDLAKLIANDNKLITLVTERLESNVLRGLEDSDDKSYQIDNKTRINEIEVPTIVETETAELEEGVIQGIITPEKDNKPLKGDWSRAKSKDKADTVKSADKTTHEKSLDASKEKTFDDTIAKIKTLKSEDKTNGEIVKILNQDGYPTFKGSKGKWRSNQVQSILKRHQ